MPSQEPTVVFHLGAVPTASWVVQQSLPRHNDTLRGSRAYALPTATLAEDLTWGDDVVPSGAAFSRTLATVFAAGEVDVVLGARDMLGSAFAGPPGSGLHAEADAAIDALESATRDYRRVIVLSVCPPEQLLDIAYERALATRQAATAQDWLARLDLKDMSWLPLHDKLSAAFADSEVIVHNFAATAQGHEDLVRAVLAAADLELPDTMAGRIPPPRLRLSDTGVSLAIAAQPFLADKRERADLDTFLQWHFSELDGPRTRLLSSQQSAALNNNYEHELTQLARRGSGAGDGLARAVREGAR